MGFKPTLQDCADAALDRHLEECDRFEDVAEQYRFSAVFHKNFLAWLSLTNDTASEDILYADWAEVAVLHTRYFNSVQYINDLEEFCGH